MREKIRILHLVPKFSRTGDTVNDYVGRLDRDRFHSVLCYLGREPEDGVTPGTYPVRFLGFGPEELKGFALRIPLQLRSLLDEEKIDLIHCNRHKSVLYAVLAVTLSRRRGIPVVASVRSMRRSRTFSRRVTNRFLFPRVARILALSEGVRQDILCANRWLDPGKVHVVHNGIDLDRFPLRRDPPDVDHWPVIGNIGRLVHTKGQRYLLQAFARILDRFPLALLKIVGDGPLEEDLKEETVHLGIEEKVRFLGFRRDISGFLQGIDLFVFPSLFEGLGLSMLEAMATGVPVVGSDVGGIPEVLQGMEAGRLVPPSDVNVLTAAIESFLNLGREALFDLGKKSRLRVEEEFSLDGVARNFERVYLEEVSRDREDKGQ
ncbi:MAG: glycosyltransferase family 4 protein [Deltaproteobacteria bacterium]|nr:glycosyltransferase family 4 protein [Deltaproteobacteria bacterium]